MPSMLRPVILPEELIGKRAPCDLFNARGMLLVNAGSLITLGVRRPFRPTRVFCVAAQASRISDVNPIVELARANSELATIAERVARGEGVFQGDLVSLARSIHEMWTIDADACLGYARLSTIGRPSICHAILVSLLVAELASAHRLDAERTRSVIGGALTMNAARFRLHDEWYASADNPSADQSAEIRSHPGESLLLLGCIGKFDRPWLDAVGSHHENMDGSGYPESLKGAEIALTARIVRVADVFAARLTGRRTRRPKHWIFQRTRGTQNIVQHVFGSDEKHLDPPLMTRLVGSLGRFPPGSMVRLNNGEMAVVARRFPGQLAMPREVLAIGDTHGNILRVPRLRPIRFRECAIRNYADEEAQRLPGYDWRQVWGYGA